MKKILFIGDSGRLTYAGSFKDALHRLGYEVIVPKYIEMHEPTHWDKLTKGKDYHAKMLSEQNQIFIATAEAEKPDMVLTISTEGLCSNFFGYCQEINLPIYMYCLDSLRWYYNGLECMHNFRMIYSYEPSDTKIEFRQGKFVKFIPLGCDMHIYKAAEQALPKKYDICFVGRLEKRRLAVLEKVAAYASKNNRSMIVYTSIQLKKIPHVWLIPKLLVRRLKYKLKYWHLMKYIVNEPIIGTDLVNLYHQSKICLNMHVGTHQGMHTGPNPRTFEVLGCKEFEIIDDGHLEQVELYDKEHLCVYHNDTEMLQLIDYYLEHDEERIKIAKAGYQKVKEVYNFDKLVRDMMDDINKEAAATSDI